MHFWNVILTQGARAFCAHMGALAIGRILPTFPALALSGNVGHKHLAKQEFHAQPAGGVGDKHGASLKGVTMVKFRSLLVVLGLAATLLIPAADAYARGGRSGGRSAPPPPDPFAAENKAVADANTAVKEAETAYNKGVSAF